MGNCCSSGDETQVTYAGKKANAFEGTGHRLGTADEARQLNAPKTNTMRQQQQQQQQEEHLPPPRDPNLTNSDRQQQRADRLAAAEARLKKQGGGLPKKDKKSSSGEPLRGPNSQNLMTWNVGN